MAEPSDTQNPSSEHLGAPPEVKKRALKTDAVKNYDQNYVRPKRKRSKKFYTFLIIGGLVIALIILSLIPPYGTMKYGLCKTFVELNDPYPKFLEWVGASESDTGAIIDYNRIDAFGQRTLNQIRCKFDTNAAGQLKLIKVNINGKNEYPQETQPYLDRFNTGIPALYNDQPSLVMPRGLPSDVKDYR